MSRLFCNNVAEEGLVILPLSSAPELPPLRDLQDHCAYHLYLLCRRQRQEMAVSCLFHNDVAEEGLVLLPLSSAPEFLCIGEYCANVFIANNHVEE